MVVIIKTKKIILGKKRDISLFLPEGYPVTSDSKKAAKLLDDELKNGVKLINAKYNNLDKETKNNSLDKWRWLGKELETLRGSLKHLEQIDFDRHVFWVAVAQYFREELRAGIDTRRAGTSKDHYRKCWLLYKSSYTNWITTWVGWDAFIDRGDQLIKEKAIMKLLSEKFGDKKQKLNSKDYQTIAKRVVQKLPSTKGAIDSSQLSKKQLSEIINSIYEGFLSQADKK